MGYEHYGLDTSKKSKDDGQKPDKWWCPWCNNDVNNGFYLCFSNWCICTDCVLTGIIAFSHMQSPRIQIGNEVECFKCGKEDVHGYCTHKDNATKIYLCELCINWADSLLNNNTMAKKKPAKRVLSEQAHEIIAHCTVDKNIVTVPNVEMTEEVNIEVKQHFIALGGEWVGLNEVKFKGEVPEDLLFIPDIPAAPAPVKKRSPRNLPPMSKVSFHTSALEEALSKSKEVIDPKNVLPVTLNVLLEVLGTRARFVSTDITVTLQVDIPCENPDNESFSVLIPFDFLYGVVKLNKNQTLELETNTAKLILKGVNDNYEVNVLDDIKDYPKMPEFPEGNVLELAVDIIPAISAALDTISKDSLRPSMCTVCLHLEQGQISVVSTDSNVLYKKTFESEAYTFDNQELLISPKVVKLLNGFGNTTISWSEHHIAFTSNNVTVITKSLSEKYPAYKNVLPLNPEVNLTCNRSQLIDAISKAMLATDGTKRCNFLLKQQIGRVRVEGVDRDRDRNIHVELPIDYSGPCEQVAVSGALMLTLLKQVSYEDIDFCISSASAPILLKSSTDAGYTGLIVPLIVND